MGTTAYGGKGGKGRAANGDRPVGAASCRRDHHTMVSCQNPRAHCETRRAVPVELRPKRASANKKATGRYGTRHQSHCTATRRLHGPASATRASVKAYIGPVHIPQEAIRVRESQSPKPKVRPKLTMEQVASIDKRLYEDAKDKQRGQTEKLAAKYLSTTPAAKLKSAKDMEDQVKRCGLFVCARGRGCVSTFECPPFCPERPAVTSQGAHRALCPRCARIVRQVGYFGPVFPDGRCDRSNYCVPRHRTAQILTQSKNSDNELKRNRARNARFFAV